MNNIKKTGLGLLVAVLAFGFSAFTNKRTPGVYRFYKTNTTFATPSDYRGYQYFTNDHCESGGSLCSALWYTGSSMPPSEGASLSSLDSFQGEIIAGHFVE